ncbi:hypothetical protein Scep_026521 [Stephania cephalantha]|uniref:Uncharacterized protein n=1 Tax=Stephania cephalantha TaxID=152367 RepID=A0AAP0HS48_9MAGN
MGGSTAERGLRHYRQGGSPMWLRGGPYRPLGPRHDSTYYTHLLLLLLTSPRSSLLHGMQYNHVRWSCQARRESEGTAGEILEGWRFSELEEVMVIKLSINNKLAASLMRESEMGSQESDLDNLPELITVPLELLMMSRANENALHGGVGRRLARTILCKNLGYSSDADLETHLMVVVVSKGVVLAKLTWQQSIGEEELLWHDDQWRANGGLPRGGSWRNKKTRAITQRRCGRKQCTHLKAIQQQQSSDQNQLEKKGGYWSIFNCIHSSLYKWVPSLGCKWGGESPWGRGFPATGIGMENLNGDGGGDGEKISYSRGYGYRDGEKHIRGDPRGDSPLVISVGIPVGIPIGNVGISQGDIRENPCHTNTKQIGPAITKGHYFNKGYTITNTKSEATGPSKKVIERGGNKSNGKGKQLLVPKSVKMRIGKKMRLRGVKKELDEDQEGADGVSKDGDEDKGVEESNEMFDEDEDEEGVR